MGALEVGVRGTGVVSALGSVDPVCCLPPSTPAQAHQKLSKHPDQLILFRASNLQLESSALCDKRVDNHELFNSYLIVLEKFAK